jgi:hypothetical protein
MQIVFRSSHLLMTPCLLLHCLRLSLLICKVHNMYEIMQSLTIAGVSLDREAGYDRHPTVLRGLDLEFIHYLKGARDLCRSLDLMKKQCVVGSTQLQNRCLLRQRIFHLPAAYPRIDPASLIQTDPQRFWITGRLSSVYHR